MVNFLRKAQKVFIKLVSVAKNVESIGQDVVENVESIGRDVVILRLAP